MPSAIDQIVRLTFKASGEEIVNRLQADQARLKATMEESNRAYGDGQMATKIYTTELASAARELASVERALAAMTSAIDAQANADRQQMIESAKASAALFTRLRAEDEAKDASIAAASATNRLTNAWSEYMSMTAPLPSQEREKAQAAERLRNAFSDYAGATPKATQATNQLGDSLQRLGVSLAPRSMDIGNQVIMIDRLGVSAARAGGQVAGGMGRRGSGGLALLEFSRLAEDAQYGVAGVLNNIPTLAMALGGSGGLAGTISLVAVGANLLYKHWDEIATLWRSDDASKAAQDLERQAKAVKEQAEQWEKLKGLKSEESKLGGSAIEKAIAATPGTAETAQREVAEQLYRERHGNKTRRDFARQTPFGESTQQYDIARQKASDDAKTLLTEGSDGDQGYIRHVAELMQGQRSEFALALRDALKEAAENTPEAKERDKISRETLHAMQELSREEQRADEKKKEEAAKVAQGWDKVHSEQQKAAAAVTKEYEDATKQAAKANAPTGGVVGAVRAGGGSGGGVQVGAGAGGSGGGVQVGGATGDALGDNVMANALQANIRFDRANAGGPPSKAKMFKLQKEAVKQLNEELHPEGKSVWDFDETQQKEMIDARVEKLMGKGDPAHDREAFNKQLRERIRGYVHNQLTRQGFTDEQIGDAPDKMAGQALDQIGRNQRAGKFNGLNAGQANMQQYAELQSGLIQRGMGIQQQTLGAVNGFTGVILGVQGQQDAVMRMVEAVRRDVRVLQANNQQLAQQGHTAQRRGGR